MEFTLDELKHEVQSLFEVKEKTQEELRGYLTFDHPPCDVHDKIAQLRSLLADIDYLIADVQAQIASCELNKCIMREYAMVHSMNRMSI